MRTRLMLVAVAAALSVLAPPSHAQPYAGRYLYLDAYAGLRGADGVSYQVHVHAGTNAAAPVAGAGTGVRSIRYAVLEWSRCTTQACKLVSRELLSLNEREIAIPGDYREGDLATRASVAVAVSLEAAKTTRDGYFSGAGLTTATPGVSPELTYFYYSAGKVRVGLLTCRALPGAQVGEITTVDTLGPEARGSAIGRGAPVGLFKGKGKARCA